MTEGDFPGRVKDYSIQEAFMRVASIEGRSMSDFWKDADSIIAQRKALRESMKG